MDAGDAATGFGMALREQDGTSLRISGLTVALAVESLDTCIARLDAGEWASCWCGLEDLKHADDKGVLVQVRRDRALLT